MDEIKVLKFDEVSMNGVAVYQNEEIKVSGTYALSSSLRFYDETNKRWLNGKIVW